MDSDAHSQATPLTAEVLARWKAELREFFSTTQRQLDLLREEGPAEAAVHASSAPVRPAAQPAAEAEHSSSSGRASTDEESFDRLQAIKRRLAAQLENAPDR